MAPLAPHLRQDTRQVHRQLVGVAHNAGPVAFVALVAKLGGHGEEENVDAVESHGER